MNFLTDKERLTHDQVLELLHARLPSFAMTKSERVPLSQTLGRIMAQDLVSPHHVPLHTNAAVDGYAFLHKDFNSKKLPVSTTIAAGELMPRIVDKGYAVRIFTGATLPDGADTIAMQEECVFDAGYVRIPDAIKKGANCRIAGEDVKKSEVVIPKARRITAADIATAASIGADSLEVIMRPKILLLSSGNELRSVENINVPLQAGEVWDANAPLLQSLAMGLPIEMKIGGIMPDDKRQVRDVLKQAAQDADMIVTTGGASYGDEDHMATSLQELGECHLWQLAIKPGRPMMMGQIRGRTKDCLFMGLPGNPVAAMVCFLLYVREALLLLGGAEPTPVPRYRLPTLFAVEGKKPNRREFRRGILVQTKNGHWAVDQFPSTGSGLISSLRKSQGLIEIEEDIVCVKKGDAINFIPYASFD